MAGLYWMPMAREEGYKPLFLVVAASALVAHRVLVVLKEWQ